MPKKYLDIDVLTAARQRVEWVFDNFPRVYVSFSAGKDSTVMLHLVAEEARKRGRRFGLLLVDLEGQYKLTIEHALACYAMYADMIDPYWCCLPIHLRNAVSVYQPFWLCWDPGVKDMWIRQIPKGAVSDPTAFPFFSQGMEFEEFVPEFGEWYAGGEQTACLVGIRADESLNRYRTVGSPIRKERLLNQNYTTRVTPNVYNVYPIYDWTTEDIWTFHGKHPNLPYNKLYDLMYQAGLPMGLMRICQPYGDDQRRGLWLFHLIEPETWARVVARVNGANMGAMYVRERGNIMGYVKVAKPEHLNWKEFATMLAASMPPATKEHYENKIILFCRWWEARGYPDGIPDEAEYGLEQARLVPSWRRVCKMLLRNDYWGKGLGFSQQKSAAYEKYLSLMRRRRQGWGLQTFLDAAAAETSLNAEA